MFNKKKTMTLSQYFQVIKPKYMYLRLTPDTSIRNYNSSNIAKAMHHMQKKITDMIEFQEKKFTFKTSTKCTYIIDIFKDKVDFFFIVPDQYANIAKEKIKETWPKITVEQVDGVTPFSPEALKYQLLYKNEDAFSLSVDKKSNEPLNHILNVIDIMQDNDRVSILYNFIPCSQVGWVSAYDKSIEKFKNRKPVDREKINAWYVVKSVFLIMAEIIDDILSLLRDDSKKSKASFADVAMTALGIEKELDTATNKKRNNNILKTQLMVLSESEDKNRKQTNALSVCQSYRSVAGENNELVYKKVKENTKNDYYVSYNKGNVICTAVPRKESLNIEQHTLPIETNKMSIDECQNLIELPGRELLQQFPNIAKIDTLQTDVPKQLENGVIRAGVNTFHEKNSQVYHTEDKELSNTAICLCGPNRSGKSTLIANIVYDVMHNGRTVILPDFCGKCQLSNELAAVIPKERILNIECNDYNTLQGFGFNEIVSKDNSIFELYNCAKMKSAKVKELINLVNDGDSDLEGRMERYLEYAALVVFVCNGPVNDVFKVLKDHVLRHKYIDSIPAELKETMDEYVTELLEIDEWSKATKDNPAEVIGTKQGHISAILSRVHRLKENAYIEMMLKKSTDNNVNLIEETQKGKLICIKMYDSMFPTQQQKDIYVCYWMTKIWGALQKRYCDIPQEELVQTVILIDELYQTKNCEKYLTMILSQMPKYRTKLVLSCHHLGQIPTIQEELKSAMCSYTFIAGSNKKNFTAMKEEFEDKGYSLEDLLHLKRYTALNLLAYEDGYWAGITKLPPPIK